MAETTAMLCGHPRCNHIWDRFIYFDENGIIESGTDRENQRAAIGGTAVCSKCGADAITESLMGD